MEENGIKEENEKEKKDQKEQRIVQRKEKWK